VKYLALLKVMESRPTWAQSVVVCVTGLSRQDRKRLQDVLEAAGGR
jgi:hypothetical protein